MNKITKYIFCLAGAAAAVACSSSSTEDPTPAVSTELSFTVSVNTRALPVKTELADGERMNVYQSTKRLPDATSVMAEGVSSDGVWRGKPALMLESGETYLYAAYPYDGAATDPSAIPVKASEQVDYLYSGTSPVFTTTAPRGALVMKHAQAIAAFNLRKAGYAGAGALSKIRISGSQLPVEGTMNVATGQILTTRKGDVAVSCQKTLLEEEWEEELPALFLLPFSSSGADMTVTFTIDGNDYACLLPKIVLEANCKYVFHLALTGNGLTLFANRTETVSLTDDGETLDASGYGVVRLLFTGTQLTVPYFPESGVYGSIFWGDETQEHYAAGAKHTYDAAGAHRVTVETWGATGVQLTDLKGVEEIDLSEF